MQQSMPCDMNALYLFSFLCCLYFFSLDKTSTSVIWTSVSFLFFFFFHYLFHSNLLLAFHFSPFNSLLIYLFSYFLFLFHSFLFLYFLFFNFLFHYFLSILYVPTILFFIIFIFSRYSLLSNLSINSFIDGNILICVHNLIVLDV